LGMGHLPYVHLLHPHVNRKHCAVSNGMPTSIEYIILCCAATWHHGANGILAHGIMEGVESCPTCFEIYYSYNLKSCPFILMVCCNPHSHPNPTPSKTPNSILKIFNSLLLHLDWHLADATPHQILLDSAFMTGLRNALHWSSPQDPTLSNLHPSFGNSDHTARLINNLWFTHYPYRTGFQGKFYCFIYIM